MNLKQRLISALGWSVAAKAGFQILTWIMTLVVIRILQPSDYGLMALSQVFANFMLGFSNLGLGDALVQRRDTPVAMQASVSGILLVVSIALMALMALAAYPIADWYGDPRLVPLIQVSSFGFLFNGLTTLPRALLLKSLRVRPMFIMELAAGLSGAIVVLVLAFSGHGVWSLMLGWLAGNAVRLMLFAVLTPEYFLRPQFRLALVRPLFGYGTYRLLENLAWFVMTSVDVLIAGRMLGTAELGLYTVALNFAAMPVNKIAPIVNSVIFPAFALVQDNPADARFYALKGLRMMSAAAVPVFFGIGAVAPEIVDLVFGPQWTGTRPLLAVMAPALTFRALLIVLANYLQGIGDARGGFWSTAAGAVILPFAVFAGCWFGVEGAAVAWLVSYPLVLLANALLVSYRDRLPAGAVLAAPVRPVLAGVIMAAAVTAARLALPPDVPEVLRLACLVAAGAVVYLGSIAVLAPGLRQEFARLRPGAVR